MSHQQLSDFVTVRGRYQKSIHLERDARSDGALGGYIVTPLVRGVLGRLAAGLESDSQQRACSITGPYGTGKSALAVLWASLVSESREPRAEAARTLVRTADPDLHRRITRLLPERGGFVTVLATGERSGLDFVLLRALGKSLERFWSGRGAKPTILRNIGSALQNAERGRQIGVRQVVELFEEAALKVRNSAQPGAGLVVILDEAGKCLEHAAHSPARGDVQLLQELAEAANRSSTSPILFITILHQSIERYATRLGATHRNEWAKVQGRFEDIAFQEEADQLLKLVGAALERTRALPKPIEADFGNLVGEVARLSSAGDEKRETALRRELAQVFPLHPLTALVLGPLFRARLAQNERSLFSFLCSGEPLGFRAHLDRAPGKDARGSLYTLDQLYDYVVATLGPQLFGVDGRVWSEIDTALRRIPRDGDQMDVRLLKAAGLLSIIGDAAGVRASSAVLLAALDDGSAGCREHVTASIDRLARSSAVIYRKYRDAYQIWEGSDLNLDDLVRSAFDQTDTRTGLARRLTQMIPPRPVVARRHLFHTGTLRYFEVRYVEADEIQAEMQIQPGPDADGGILIALARAGGDVGSVRELVSQKMLWFTVMADRTKPVVIGVPRNAGHLADLAAELAALEWVQSNTHELGRDPVARRELSARISETQRLIHEEAGRLMDGGSPGACDWYYKGERLPVEEAPDLSRCVSDVCDQVYDHAPIVLNELLNRRNLSSAAAAARRNLLEAMLLHAEENRLGFEAFPPEVSMYRSVLEAHGLHRKIKGKPTIAAPTSASMKAAWAAIQAFLASTEDRRLSVADLYAELAKPPFGIKDGLAPVLVWAALIHLETEVALYEQGSFVPGLTAPIMERLLRWPEKFDLQRFKIAGVRAKVFERFGRALLSAGDADHPTLLAVVKSLVKFVADLPDFARVTKRLSPIAQNVRNTLVRAKEPAPLLFRDLPIACECTPFEAKAKAQVDEVERFFVTLRRSIGELQNAYPTLLTEIEGHIKVAFDLGHAKSPLHAELAPRAARLMALSGEPELKAFLMRAGDNGLAPEEWIVSVATYLATKPPVRWNDTDFEGMQAKLARLVPKFRALESLAVQINRTGDGPHNLIRLSITQPHQTEIEKVVAIPESDLDLVRDLQAAILRAVGWTEGGQPAQHALAALARAAQTIIEVAPAAGLPSRVASKHYDA